MSILSIIFRVRQITFFFRVFFPFQNLKIACFSEVFGFWELQFSSDFFQPFSVCSLDLYEGIWRKRNLPHPQTKIFFLRLPKKKIKKVCSHQQKAIGSGANFSLCTYSRNLTLYVYQFSTRYINFKYRFFNFLKTARSSHAPCIISDLPATYLSITISGLTWNLFVNYNIRLTCNLFVYYNIRLTCNLFVNYNIGTYLKLICKL